MDQNCEAGIERFLSHLNVNNSPATEMLKAGKKAAGQKYNVQPKC